MTKSPSNRLCLGGYRCIASRGGQRGLPSGRCQTTASSNLSRHMWPTSIRAKSASRPRRNRRRRKPGLSSRRGAGCARRAWPLTAMSLG